jgi:beta-galactosidase
MHRIPFNTGWRTRPKVNPFLEFEGVRVPFEDVTLPHDAMLRRSRDPNLAFTSAYFPGGVDEYHADLDAPGEWAEKYVALHFEGAYRKAMVYVNNTLAGQWAYGYTEFTVELSPYLRYGEQNRIRVETRDHLDSRWYSGAGLYREVHLVVADVLHVGLDGVRVTTPDVDAERAVVEVATTVENGGRLPRTVAVRTAIGDLADTTKVTVLPGEPAIVRQRLYLARPRLWSVADPALYTATVILCDGADDVDEASTTFGIRTLRLDPEHGLRINGETVLLRGACIHHDNGVLGAATIARADERRVEQLKAAGFNAIRMAHHPMSRALLDACDRVGVLVMDEAFDMWTIAKTDHDYALDFSDWWERDVAAMVAKDFNHPSVILYSIGNEIPELGSPMGGVWSRRLAEKVRALDPTRYVTNGVNGGLAVFDTILDQLREGAGINTVMGDATEAFNLLGASDLVTERTAESFAVLDVAGMNYMDARYAADRSAFPNRIIVGTETFPPHIDVLWSLVKEHPHVIGDFTWTGYDYLGEVGVGRVKPADDPHANSFGQPYPWLTAWCGDLDITGQRRPQSFYREIVFGLRSDPYLTVQRPSRHGEKTATTPWAWSDSIASWTWSGFEGRPVAVEVYADADEVLLELDGRTLGTASVERFKAQFDITYQPGTLVAIALRAGAQTGRCTVRTAAGAPSLVAIPDRSTLAADDRDLAFVDIALVDADGTVFTDRDTEVTVAIAGPGLLQGFGSAAPAGEESFLDDVHRTFDGRALAVIRPTGPGTITVTVSAGDLTATANVDAT